MRFSTLVTFMLPLSALAAPSLVERQSAALEAARKDVVDGLANAGKAVNTTLAQAAAIKNPPQQAVIYDATKVQGNLAFANAAVDRIGDSIQAAEPSKESDQLEVVQGILEAQDILNRLEGKINDGSNCQCDGQGKGKGDGKGKTQAKGKTQVKGKGKSKSKEPTKELNDLRTSIGQARDGIALALQGSVSVLEQQGKSVRKLFEGAKLPVPPCF